MSQENIRTALQAKLQAEIQAERQQHAAQMEQFQLQILELQRQIAQQAQPHHTAGQQPPNGGQPNEQQGTGENSIYHLDVKGSSAASDRDTDRVRGASFATTQVSQWTLQTGPSGAQ